MRHTLIILLVLTQFVLFSQRWDPIKKCIVDQANPDRCLSNTILTAVPFLRINPDTRSGGIGDAGVALSTDPNAMHHNAARLAFAENNLSIAANYSPWLRNLGIDDIYLLYLTGYYKIDKIQSAGIGIRFFSMGTIDFRDENGNDIGTGNPNELELTAAYARKLSDKLAASLSAKFIYSNLATGKMVGASDIYSARAFGADIGVLYKDKLGSSGRRNYLSVGLAITNIGNKVSYTRDTIKDFIPTNIGLGANYEMNFDDYNSLNLVGEINKLMVPSHIPQGDPNYDKNNNKEADYREKDLFSGIFGSFSDAPGGFTEELQELMYSIGIEYWYDKQFAVRLGYFNEHALKGNRKFLTLGCGLKYKVFGLNVSYLVPTVSTRSPLANTVRFSLTYDLQGSESE